MQSPYRVNSVINTRLAIISDSSGHPRSLPVTPGHSRSRPIIRGHSCTGTHDITHIHARPLTVTHGIFFSRSLTVTARSVMFTHVTFQSSGSDEVNPVYKFKQGEQ